MKLFEIGMYWDVVKLGIIALFSFLLIGLVLSIPLCLLWNWLIPNIFGLPTINVLEAFGLSALVTFLSPQKVDLAKKETKSVDENYLKELENTLANIDKEFKN